MANTYTQLYVHCVFAVKFRQALIHPAWEDELHKYITGIVQNNHHKMIAINSAPDHLHMFIGLNPNQSISQILQLVKGDSSEQINKQRLTRTPFQWQRGYGAFTNSRTQIDAVVNYIARQKEHHQQHSFRNEYVKMLQDYGIDYNDKYLFHEPIE